VVADVGTEAGQDCDSRKRRHGLADRSREWRPIDHRGDATGKSERPPTRVAVAGDRLRQCSSGLGGTVNRSLRDQAVQQLGEAAVHGAVLVIRIAKSGQELGSENAPAIDDQQCRQ
jgi:hypothetical protein